MSIVDKITLALLIGGTFVILGSTYIHVWFDRWKERRDERRGE